MKAEKGRGATRAVSEDAWLYFGDVTGLPVHVFRLAGIYGPGRNAIEAAKRVSFPDLICQASACSEVHHKVLLTERCGGQGTGKLEPGMTRCQGQVLILMSRKGWSAVSSQPLPCGRRTGGGGGGGGGSCRPCSDLWTHSTIPQYFTC